jgi:hypothetical protein
LHAWTTDVVAGEHGAISIAEHRAIGTATPSDRPPLLASNARSWTEKSLSRGLRSPTSSPERLTGRFQAGKLPRQAGVTLVRHGHQYELAIQAETLAVSGAKQPTTEEGEERARVEERVDQVRYLIETVDLLYGLFLDRRLGLGWPEELRRMQRWLQSDERTRLAS